MNSTTLRVKYLGKIQDAYSETLTQECGNRTSTRVHSPPKNLDRHFGFQAPHKDFSKLQPPSIVHMLNQNKPV